VRDALLHGALSERGLLPYSSNHSFLAVAMHEEIALPAVYKPQRGENPLWDFEWGTLCKRETAAYVVSRALGWDLVPPTVLREGSRGLGSVQFFVQHDADQHYFTVQANARFAPTLRRLALFDAITNNADRKSGHCLIDADNRLWAIDHGLCFHTEYKLRTVIWEFSDEPIAEALLDGMRRLRAQLQGEAQASAGALLNDELCVLLHASERRGLLARVSALISHGLYPAPHPGRRNYPWPPV